VSAVTETEVGRREGMQMVADLRYKLEIFCYFGFLLLNGLQTAT
jgi:hypothetical protein